MKKLFITLFIVTGFYSLSHAQTKNTEYGINIGFSDSYVSDGQSGYGSSDLVAGFNAGVYADHYFSDSWSLKVKAIYDQKGWGNGYLQVTSPDGSTTTTTDHLNFRLNYLTVPVMANWHFGRDYNWYANFGPYVGFLLSASENYDNTNVKDIFNTVDGGISVGVGYKFPITDRSNFFIEYEGQGGVVNVSKNSDGGLYQNVRESINVGISF